MATFVMTSGTTLSGTAWTGTAPGPGNPTVSGTISSSTDWSDHIRQVTFNMASANVDFTSMGSAGYVNNKPGLIDADVSIEFYNDFVEGGDVARAQRGRVLAVSNVDAIFGAGLLAGTLFYFDFKPTSSSRAATNPSYVVGLYVASCPPLGVAVGDAATATIGFMNAGKYARLTS